MANNSKWGAGDDDDSKLTCQLWPRLQILSLFRQVSWPNSSPRRTFRHLISRLGLPCLLFVDRVGHGGHKSCAEINNLQYSPWPAPSKATPKHLQVATKRSGILVVGSCRNSLRLLSARLEYNNNNKLVYFDYCLSRHIFLSLLRA